MAMHLIWKDRPHLCSITLGLTTSAKNAKAIYVDTSLLHTPSPFSKLAVIQGQRGKRLTRLFPIPTRLSFVFFPEEPKL